MNARLESSEAAEPAQGALPAWADWVTIWQSEWAALAADREMQEAAQRGIDLWAAQAAQRAIDSWAAQATARRDDPAGCARPAPAPRPASALASPDRPHPDKPGRDPF